ncbi:PucR family transcriptional regulator [Pseudonocardia xinjiangensis]|uniref:PucR family transcriptional regulator n=1 Tax=Pseudonocardia xinjiangensis TaxID=75289 RepID=UPI003D8BC3B7
MGQAGAEPSDDAGGPLTLRRLAAEPGLGLTLVEGEDLSATVRGAHSIEIEHAASWLRPGSIMLTTGLRFACRDVAGGEWRALVAELVDAGVAGLLFGVGPHFGEVPPGLRHAARVGRLPLLSVDAATPFTVIEEFVNSGALAAETYLLRRTVWLQNDLLRALTSDDPVATLVGRLAAMCRGAAALYAASGRIVASTGNGPFRLIRDEIDAREPAGRHHFSVGRWSVTCRPFAVGGAAYRLAVASQDAVLVGNLGDDLLQTAERVLAASNSVWALAVNHERAEAARLMSALQAGISASRVRQTWDRLRPFRFRAGSPLRVARATPVDPRPPDRARAADAVVEEIHSRGLAVVLHQDGEAGDVGPPMTALLAAGEPTDEWLDLLGDSHLVGVSGTFTELTDVPGFVDEAVTAWRVAARRQDRGGLGSVVRLDTVDFATWLMARRDDTRVAERFDRHFGSLARSPDLVATVVVFLAVDQDVKRTAERLFVHPNTIRYRLRKVEQILGEPLTSPRAVANLYLAFQDEVLAHRAQE